jgi:hypothetical protein
MIAFLDDSIEGLTAVSLRDSSSGKQKKEKNKVKSVFRG